MTEKVPLQPTEEERRRIMELVITAGKTQLENGAEVFRAQQTMEHMAAGLNLREFNAYVLTNGIFASAGTSEYAEVRNIPNRSVHLGRVEGVNELSRQIARGELSITQAEVALATVRKIPMDPPKMRILASGVGACAFCLLYGGGIIDGMVSLLAGFLLGWYLIVCQKRASGGFFQRISGSALVSLFCLLASTFFNSLDVSSAIIGAFMLLTPGVAFTMAIRDFVHSDYLSGTIRAIDAILIAASIACGAGLIIMLEQYFMGVLL